MKSRRKGTFKHYDSQTSKETLRRSGKYMPPQKIPTIYKPYYWLEKRVLEPCDGWISKQAFFTLLEKLGYLAVVVAVVTFVFGENVRRNNEVFTAWQTITSAQGQSGSGGRIEALEFLNSRPLRFPWIGWTSKNLYWDKQKDNCKLKRLWGRRWERQPLEGLSAPNAYLLGIHLCMANLENADLSVANLAVANLSGANLMKANLSGTNLAVANLSLSALNNADLSGANLRIAGLSGADLSGVNLSGANLRGAIFTKHSIMMYGVIEDKYLRKVIGLSPKQVKSACHWEKALFDPDFEEKLKKEPDQEVDCSSWEEN